MNKSMNTSMNKTALAIAAVLCMSGCNDDNLADKGQKAPGEGMQPGAAAAETPVSSRPNTVPPPSQRSADAGTAPASAAPYERTNTASTRPAADAHPVDTSGVTVRDQKSDLPTVGDQSESAADLAISKQARQMVVADDHLSIKAKNVKIITIDGVVTLRGAVDSESERASISSKVAQITGVRRIDNNLEIVQ